jgi:hypothetical protein
VVPGGIDRERREGAAFVPPPGTESNGREIPLPTEVTYRRASYRTVLPDCPNWRRQSWEDMCICRDGISRPCTDWS